MARQLRVEYSGAIYHVMSRGNRKESIYRDNEDRLRFMKALGETCERADWEVHAYCLMGNHFHLVLETPKPTLVAGMKWLLGTYTQRFNARHRLRGHLFAGRYKSLIVDGSDDFYLRIVCDYVHLNPLRARLLKDNEPLESYAWSSFPEYLRAQHLRASWLRVDRLLGEHGIQKDSSRGRKEFQKFMAERCRQEGHAEDKLWAQIRRGWKFGAEDFVERLTTMVPEKNENRSSHLSDMLGETMEEKARGIIRDFLKKENLEMEPFLSLKKGDPIKIRLAAKLRKKTAVTMTWIAQELNAGVPQTLWKALWKAGQKGDNTRD